MKKLFAVLMAIAIVLSMGTLALAAGNGTITNTNAVDGADYEVYKMLDFAPSNATGDKGIYTIVDGWADFFAEEPATNFFTVVTNADQTTVSLKKDIDSVDQALAKAAIAYADKNGIDATKTATANGTTVEFANLDLGYYAIDTSLGTLCALTNTNSDFTATEKNSQPDIDKLVQEDSLSEKAEANYGWNTVNDADIGQKVDYKSTITVGVGATNYVMHDTMEDGLTFNNDVVVKLADGTVVDAANYTVVYDETDNKTDDGHTFDVVFENSFIEGLALGTTFTVYYSATLNENANVVVDGNDNTVYLSYGEDSTWETDEHKTTTYTWKIDIFKFTMDGESKTPLAGATFNLLNANGEVIKFSKVDGTEFPTYVVDSEGTADITTDTTGKFFIIGLDEGKYELEETDAPDGYNKLAANIDVVIGSDYNYDNLTATYHFVETIDDVETEVEPTTIEVENKTGGLFPETGGIGTTIFTVVGIAIMLAAAVILVSKKRMATAA